jgi:hypothetical protein
MGGFFVSMGERESYPIIEHRSGTRREDESRTVGRVIGKARQFLLTLMTLREIFHPPIRNKRVALLAPGSVRAQLCVIG